MSTICWKILRTLRVPFFFCPRFSSFLCRRPGSSLRLKETTDPLPAGQALFHHRSPPSISTPPFSFVSPFLIFENHAFLLGHNPSGRLPNLHASRVSGGNPFEISLLWIPRFQIFRRKVTSFTPMSSWYVLCRPPSAASPFSFGHPTPDVLSGPLTLKDREPGGLVKHWGIQEHFFYPSTSASPPRLLLRLVSPSIPFWLFHAPTKTGPPLSFRITRTHTSAFFFCPLVSPLFLSFDFFCPPLPSSWGTQGGDLSY